MHYFLSIFSVYLICINSAYRDTPLLHAPLAYLIPLLSPKSEFELPSEMVFSHSVDEWIVDILVHITFFVISLLHSFSVVETGGRNFLLFRLSAFPFLVVHSRDCVLGTKQNSWNV